MIVAFPVPTLRSAIVIDAGTVTASTHRPDIGRYLYFVSWCDADGAELVLNTTDDRDVAFADAREACADFHAPLVDRSKQ